MLPIVLALAALALLTSVALLVLRSRPEKEPAAVEPEAPKPAVRVIAEAVPAPARISGEVESHRAPAPADSSDALETLDALLAELESATVRIDGADALDETSVATLEGLADRLEAAAESLAAR